MAKAHGSFKEALEAARESARGREKRAGALAARIFDRGAVNEKTTNTTSKEGAGK